MAESPRFELDCHYSVKQWHALVNIMKNGSMKFFLISFDKLDSDESILTKMGSSQSAMGLNFTKTFG